ncbi:MAG: hypothetical protein OH344_01700 [Candidatus Parvarchaeota archaeon]|nr:hypothetical protein [Candidatus Jingweiarchaeum tengchongense]
MSDELYACGSKDNLENNYQNAIKLSDFEASETSAHAYNMSDMSDMSAYIYK